MPAPIVVGADLSKAYNTTQDLQKFRQGQKYYDEMGNEHIFVKYYEGDGSVAGTAGLFVALADTTKETYEATADLNDADVLVNKPAGQLQATLADGESGFAQCKGLNRIAAVTDGSVTKDGPCVLTAGDGTIQLWATGQRVTLGTARETDDGTDLAIGELYIDCPV
jgi:hypothetical protein